MHRTPHLLLPTQQVSHILSHSKLQVKESSSLLNQHIKGRKSIFPVVMRSNSKLKTRCALDTWKECVNGGESVKKMWAEKQNAYPVLPKSIFVTSEDISTLARHLITWRNAPCCSHSIITEHKNTIINVISGIV